MAAAKKDTLTTRFDPELLEQLRARFTWWRRSSQREVLEGRAAAGIGRDGSGRAGKGFTEIPGIAKND
jgi:hypothetical protein